MEITKVYGVPSIIDPYLGYFSTIYSDLWLFNIKNPDLTLHEHTVEMFEFVFIS